MVGPRDYLVGEGGSYVPEDERRRIEDEERRRRLLMQAKADIAAANIAQHPSTVPTGQPGDILLGGAGPGGGTLGGPPINPEQAVRDAQQFGMLGQYVPPPSPIPGGTGAADIYSNTGIPMVPGTYYNPSQSVDVTGTMTPAEITAENQRLMNERIARERARNIGPNQVGFTPTGDLPYATAMNADQQRMQMLEVQNQEIMNMLRAQGAGQGAGGVSTADAPTVPRTPVATNQQTLYGGGVFDPNQMTGVGPSFEPKEPVAQRDATGLVDLNKYAADKFGDAVQQYQESGGELHYQLIHEALKNWASQGGQTQGGWDLSYLFSKIGMDSHWLLNDLSREFNNATQGPNAEATPEEFLFKYTGAGPNTNVGQALKSLAMAEGNLSALLPYDREIINSWTEQGNQIPYDLYGIPSGPMGAGAGAETPSLAVGAGDGTAGEQLTGVAGEYAPGAAGAAGVAGAPGQVGAPGQAGTRLSSEVYNEAYDVLEQLRQGDQNVRLPAEIYDLQLREGSEYGGPATDLIDQFNQMQSGMSPFGPEFNIQEARLEAEAGESVLQRDFDQRQAELDRGELQRSQEAQLEEQRATRIEQGEQFYQGLQNELAIEAGKIGLQAGIAFTENETIRMGQNLQEQQFYSNQNFDRDQNRLDRNLQKDLSEALNKNNVDIANISADATMFVATENGLAARDVAIYNMQSAKDVAAITGQTQQDVANIQGQYQQRLADMTNTTQTEIAEIQAASQLAVEKERIGSNEYISGVNITSAEVIAGLSKTSALEVANAQKAAAESVALANNTTAEVIATMQGADAFSLAQMQITTQFANEKDIALLQKQYQAELATLTGTTGEQIATINNAAIQALEDSRLAGQKDAYEAQIASQETLASAQIAMQVSEAGLQRGFETAEAAAQRAFETSEAAAQRGLVTGEGAAQRGFETAEAGAQRTFAEQQATAQRGFETGEAAAQRAFETGMGTAERTFAEQQAGLQRGFETGEATAQRAFETTEAGSQRTFAEQQAALDRAQSSEIAKIQYLNDLQPVEFAELQKDIARGGMTVEESESLAALVARGGLTAEQRITEMNAGSRSAEMNAFIALLSNPSALGAFVTAISGELPFEAVPTMGQLADMTPNRIQYLQGALSALGIDPQTFIRMAQDVTPQAFQESGPFGQLTAMMA